MPAQMKPKLFESRWTSFFLSGVDAPHVYVHAWAIGCFHSLISTQTFSEGTDRVGGQLCGDKECPFSGITKSGRVWRKVPESNAWSVGAWGTKLGSGAWDSWDLITPTVCSILRVESRGRVSPGWPGVELWQLTCQRSLKLLGGWMVGWGSGDAHAAQSRTGWRRDALWSCHAMFPVAMAEHKIFWSVL